MHHTSYVLQESKINLNTHVESTLPTAVRKLSRRHLQPHPQHHPHLYRITTETREGDDAAFRRWKDKEELSIGKLRKTAFKRVNTSGCENTYVICIDKKSNKMAVVFDPARASLSNSIQFSTLNSTVKAPITQPSPILTNINVNTQNKFPNRPSKVGSYQPQHQRVSNGFGSNPLTNSDLHSHSKFPCPTGYAGRLARIKSSEKGMKNLFTSYNRFQMDERRERFSESIRKMKGLMTKGFINFQSDKCF